MTIKYKLERYVDGDWYEWGTFENVEELARASALLGRIGYQGAHIRVVNV